MDWRYLVVVFHGLGFESSTSAPKDLDCFYCNNNFRNTTTVQRNISCELTNFACECTTCKPPKKHIVPICNASKYYTENHVDKWVEQCKQKGCKYIHQQWIMISQSRLYPGLYPTPGSGEGTLIQVKTTTEDFCNRFGMRKALPVCNCGRTFNSSVSRKRTFRIAGNSVAVIYSQPWIVSFEFEFGGSKYHFCAGSLVRRSANVEKTNVVVTTAFCVLLSQDTKNWVLAGVNNLEKKNEEGIGVRVRKAIIHPNYNYRSLDNNIAVLLLESDIPFSKTIQPVCLPSQNASIPQKASVFAAGWRERESDDGKLMEVEMPIVSTTKCLPQQHSFNATMTLCAGPGGITCLQQFNSGGPLTLKTACGSVLHGIYSYSWGGMGCGLRYDNPGVYTRVSAYVKWINEQIFSQV